MVENLTIRFATSSDSATIARHRAQMFLDMGMVNIEDAAKIEAATTPWIQDLINQGQYVGWIVEQDGAIVAGAGVLLRELGPEPGCIGVGRWGHIVNVYTEMTHRRRGIARRLVQEVLSWCKEHTPDKVTLAASDEGRALYESLGFIPTMDMKLQSH